MPISGYGYYRSLSNMWLSAHNNIGTPPSSPPSGEQFAPTISGVASASASSVNFHCSSSTPVSFAPFETSEGDDVSFTVRLGAYAARYAFVELATGRRTSFVDIPVSGAEEGGVGDGPTIADRCGHH